MLPHLLARWSGRCSVDRNEISDARADEEGGLLLHEGEGETEETVLLGYTGECTGTKTGDGVGAVKGGGG
jgi:hypothetical protein